MTSSRFEPGDLGAVAIGTGTGWKNFLDLAQSATIHLLWIRPVRRVGRAVGRVALQPVINLTCDTRRSQASICQLPA